MRTSVFLAALTIVGTAFCATPPALPRRVSHTGSGRGTAYHYNELSKSYLLSDALELQWDLDRGCFAFYQYNYLAVNDWSEYSFCGGVEQKFDSDEGVCLEKRGQDVDVATHISEWWAGFNVHKGDVFTDPIWGKGTYSVFKHASEATSEVYVNIYDGQVYFIKMKDEKDVPHVIYFSTGLIEEAETQEFGLRKANCDEDNTFGKRVAVNKPSQLSKYLKGLVGPYRASAESQVDGVFSTIDANGDNQLSRGEWQMRLESQGVVTSDYEIDMIMYLLDTDRNEFISKEEFLAYAKAIDEAYPEEASSLLMRVRKDAAVEPEDLEPARWDERDWEQYDKGFEDARVEMVFEFFDDDHNGVLSRAEMKEFMIELYDHTLTEEQLDKVISYCDADYDGAVSYDELYNYVA